MQVVKMARKPVSQRCGAALSARRIVPERPGRATFPSAARNNYCTKHAGQYLPSPQTPPAGSAATETSRVSRETKGGALRGDGGRRVKWGLKCHPESRAPNNRMHLKLNHMLPVKLAQYPQGGRPRWKSHQSATLGRRQDSVAAH